jgi:hypothetical protein
MMAKPTKAPITGIIGARWTASPSCAAFHHRHWGLCFRIDHGRQKAMQIASMNKKCQLPNEPNNYFVFNK